MISTERDIELILQRLLAVSRPTTVYLFGSQAAGEANAESDVDLLVVEPSGLPRQHRSKRILAELRSFPANFDVLVYTPHELAEELSDPLSFVANITAGARVIYEKHRE